MATFCMHGGNRINEPKVTTPLWSNLPVLHLPTPSASTKAYLQNNTSRPPISFHQLSIRVVLVGAWREQHLDPFSSYRRGYMMDLLWIYHITIYNLICLFQQILYVQRCHWQYRQESKRYIIKHALYSCYKECTLLYISISIIRLLQPAF